MKNKKKISLLILLLMCLFLNKTYAASCCTSKELNNLENDIDKFNARYEYNDKNKNYTIIIFNPNPNIFTILPPKTNKDAYCSVKEEENYMYCENLPPGKYEVSLIAKCRECNSIVKKINVRIRNKSNNNSQENNDDKIVNEYSNDELCKGIEEFVLCQPNYDKKIDYETFKKRVELYRKEKDKVNSEKQNTDDKTVIYKIKDYIKNNYINVIVIGIFAIIVIISIFMTIKSIKKSRNLE